MTITDDMVERAARALHERNGFRWEALSERAQDSYRAEALKHLERKAALGGKEE